VDTNDKYRQESKIDTLSKIEQQAEP